MNSNEINERRPPPACLTLQKDTIMKSTTTHKTTMSLGDLVATVSSYSANRHETLAALQDLFRKGSVVAQTNQGRKRLKLA